MGKKKKKWRITVLICILGAGFVVFALWWNRGKEAGREDSVVKEATGSAVSGAMKDGEIADYESQGAIRLGKYKGVKVNITPTKTEVYQSILLEAEDVKIKGKEADRVEKGDWISLDYEGFIDEQPVEELNESGAVIQVGAGDLFNAAFERSLMGLKTGDDYTFSVLFAEDYFDADVAGQNVTFSVTVNSKFNDLYAEEMSKGKYKTVEEYYEYAWAKEKSENQESIGDTAWDELVKDCKVNQYPEGTRKQAYKDQRRSFKNFASASGMSYQEFIGGLGYSEGDVQSMADDMVRDRMVAKTIAKREGITLTDRQYEQFLLQFFEPEEDEEKTLKAMETRYRKEQSSYPRDDMLIERVKQYVGEQAAAK